VFGGPKPRIGTKHGSACARRHRNSSPGLRNEPTRSDPARAKHSRPQRRPRPPDDPPGVRSRSHGLLVTHRSRCSSAIGEHERHVGLAEDYSARFFEPGGLRHCHARRASARCRGFPGGRKAATLKASLTLIGRRAADGARRAHAVMSASAAAARARSKSRTTTAFILPS